MLERRDCTRRQGMSRGLLLHSFYSVVLLSVFPAAVLAQSTVTGRSARGLIVDRIDESKLHRIEGNTRSEASAENDRGAAPYDLTMDHLLLQLQRSPEQEQAVRAFIDALHDPASPDFHKWLTAAE